MVGVSYSGAVALQLAADSPTCVHSLTLLEPPPVHVPSAAQFLVANAQLLENYHAHGPVVGLDRFLTRVIGPDWRAAIERAVPGAADQMERDIGTFFDTDLPARQAGCGPGLSCWFVVEPPAGIEPATHPYHRWSARSGCNSAPRSTLQNNR